MPNTGYPAGNSQKRTHYQRGTTRRKNIRPQAQDTPVLQLPTMGTHAISMRQDNTLRKLWRKPQHERMQERTNPLRELRTTAQDVAEERMQDLPHVPPRSRTEKSGTPYPV